MTVVFFVRIFIYYYKRSSENGTKDETNNNCNNNELSLDLKSPTENTKELGKNKWLYLDDEFVKYDKPKHYKPQNYKLK